MANRGQHVVQGAIAEVEAMLPFAILGFDADNIRECLKLLHANGDQGTLSIECEGQSGPMPETSLNWLRKTLKELGIPEKF